MKRLKYLLVYILPLSVYFSFNASGIFTFFPVFLFFGVVPILDLFVKPDKTNLSIDFLQKEKKIWIYDWVLYLAIPVQLCFLIYFLFIIQDSNFWTLEFFGKISAMGLMCGVLGINIGHELGHRNNRIQQFLGEILLLSSLDTHFLPYHNGGHHRNVATEQDSASAPKNKLLFSFWFTSHFGSYLEAWKLEISRMKRRGKSSFSLDSRMVSYSIFNILLISLIYYFFGITALVAFLMSATIGILLLETVNYIEHYGLKRAKDSKGIYEPVRHKHSWNSDHPIGRLMLFNLSRHSDHHYNGSKKYQLLMSLSESPQMPTGYPGMMLMALFQPVWFYVMNRKLNEISVN